MEEEIQGVKINILGKNIEVTDYIRNYFKEKFERVVDKIPESIRESTKAYFIYKKEGKVKGGEIIITVAKRNFPALYSEYEGEDPRVIIDEVISEIEKQIEKIKTEFEREKREERKTKREIQGEALSSEEYEEEEKEKGEISSYEEPYIEVVKVNMEKPMTVEDAIFMMGEIEKKKGGKKFPIFIFNDYDGKIKVLYKKDENKFTLFEIS
jgi:ribosomal subunit interface protein